MFLVVVVILLVPCVSGVVVVENTLRDSLEHLLREDSQQLPANVKRLKHSAVLVDTCTGREGGSNIQEIARSKNHTI
jgi:uncharacterized alkaline shock family protein YloU